MTEDEYDAFCNGLPATTHVTQWGNSSVWKVGGKVFAIAGWNKTRSKLGISFKVSDLSFAILQEQPGLRPAPYLASRGMTWIQDYADPGLDDEGLKLYLCESHRLVADGLSRQRRKDLGLD
jgi:predicted DNA-binding protein (MmcQ/YjbR family)